MAPAQAFVSSYAHRLRQYGNTLLQPVPQAQSLLPGGRTTKRGTTIINYADDAYDDDDFDDSETSRRPTGLRSLRREDPEKKEIPIEKYGKEIRRPVDVQSMYRDWMTRRAVKPTTDREAHIQAQLPLTLIPIRIDLDISSWQPDAAYPLPPQQMQNNYNLTLPQYKRPEELPSYKIRDIFMWNLHENLITPDEFAQTLVRELDLQAFQQKKYIAEISGQIRTQLEEYAGIALHPLFYTQPKVNNIESEPVLAITDGQPGSAPNATPAVATPQAQLGSSLSRPASTTPAVDTPTASTPQAVQLPNGASVIATASPLAPLPEHERDGSDVTDPTLNPDDTYRCIVQLSVYLASKLYQDKFEWSLLHPPGAAEIFAKQTCGDMGLGGEWVLAITHAIYEAVLRLKKEVCEGQVFLGGEIDNEAIRPYEGAGWRYDIDDFGAEWEPKFEELSKEEIEKREYDRERQLRRLRRDAAKLTSTAGMVPTAREQEAQIRGSYFDMPGAGTGDETPLMGRGERSKKKRRFRSLSPVAKAQTPESSQAAAWGGENSRVADQERLTWRCRHCLVPAGAVWAVRDGPHGPRVSFRLQLCVLDADSFHRHSAITAACCSNETESFRFGRKISTATQLSLLSDEGVGIRDLNRESRSRDSA